MNISSEIIWPLVDLNFKIIFTSSKQGSMKKSPGPTVSFFLSRPSLKRTALSYSLTILTQNHKDNGKVQITSKTATIVKNPFNTVYILEQ